MKGKYLFSMSGTELSKLLRQYPDKPWNWNFLSENPNITMKDVLAHPNESWTWNALSANPGITMRDVEEHPWGLWNWNALSSNPNITIKDVLAYPDKSWNWDRLSRNPSISIKDILHSVAERKGRINQVVYYQHNKQHMYPDEQLHQLQPLTPRKYFISERQITVSLSRQSVPK